MPGEFERELRGILEGREDVLERVTRSCDHHEKERYRLIMEIPFMVIRAAGSFGIDLVAVRNGVLLPIEVKASLNPILYMGKEKLARQTENFLASCSRAGVTPIYAFRLKRQRGDAWRIFTLEGVEVSGVSRLIYRSLPYARKTRSGKISLHWNEGKPLNEFIEYLHSILYPGPEP